METKASVANVSAAGILADAFAANANWFSELNFFHLKIGWDKEKYFPIFFLEIFFVVLELKFVLSVDNSIKLFLVKNCGMSLSPRVLILSTVSDVSE
jgi:hypothetical protein